MARLDGKVHGVVVQIKENIIRINQRHFYGNGWILYVPIIQVGLKVGQTGGQSP